MICTGRPPRSALQFAAGLGLTQPFICFNGAALLEPATGRITVRQRLDREVAFEAVERLRRNVPGILLGLESEGGWYLDQDLFDLRRSEAKLGPEPPTGVGDVERFLDDGAVKILAQHADVTAEDLAGSIADLALYRTWSTRGLLELLHPDVNKRAGLEALCATLDVSAHEVAAFGDQRNDVEMLAWVGRGYAMGNASADARAAADAVIGSNDEDGIAVVLEEWLSRRTAVGDDA